MTEPTGTEDLTPESAKALADHVIESTVIPKTVPALDDIDGQTQALGGALASALLTATEMPLHMLQPVVGDLAAQLVALGIRQTDLVDPEACTPRHGSLTASARSRSSCQTRRSTPTVIRSSHEPKKLRRRRSGSPKLHGLCGAR